jgi:integrase
VGLLVDHKKHQAEIKMANRQTYNDQGLVFAKENRGPRHECLGDPLQANNIAQREFDKLIAKAGVRRIKFHGLRHTSATLALQAGVSIKTVQKRLGHKRVEITMNVYAHALPSDQKDAAAKMGSVLHGRP